MEQIDVASQNPDVVKRLLGELGTFSWQCPDDLCTVDSFSGTANICASLTAYGSFGPFADLPPPPPSPPVVGGVVFQQGNECLVLKGKGLILGDCETVGAQWLLKQTENIVDPERGKQQVPTLGSAALDPGLCLHLDHHDKNNTCDGTPGTNHPVMGSCGHGNGFNFTQTEGESGRLEILECPNWGAEGACLVSYPSLVASTGASVVRAGACDATAALWTKAKKA